MAPKSVTFRRHDHLVSVLFGDLLSHSYNITFTMFLYLVGIYFVVVTKWESVYQINYLQDSPWDSHLLSFLCPLFLTCIIHNIFYFQVMLCHIWRAELYT